MVGLLAFFLFACCFSLLFVCSSAWVLRLCWWAHFLCSTAIQAHSPLFTYMKNSVCGGCVADVTVTSDNWLLADLNTVMLRLRGYMGGGWVINGDLF